MKETKCTKKLNSVKSMIVVCRLTTMLIVIFLGICGTDAQTKTKSKTYLKSNTVTKKKVTTGIYIYPEDSFFEGEKYEGQLVNNLPNGKGTLAVTNKKGWEGTYVGEFRNGQLDGQGTYNYKNGYSHSGEYKSNKRNGYGNEILENGDKRSGYFRNSLYLGIMNLNSNKDLANGAYTYTSGATFIGQIQYGLPNGNGKIRYNTPPGAEGTYEGEFKDGDRYGQGIYKWDNGLQFDGIWKNDNAVKGTVFYTNGAKYVGDVNLYLQKNGYGITYNPDGSKNYEGEWKEDKKITDRSTEIASPTKPNIDNQVQTSNIESSGKYVGELKDGLRNGKGALYTKKGKLIKKGYWYNNEYVGVNIEDYMTAYNKSNSNQSKSTTAEINNSQDKFAIGTLWYYHDHSEVLGRFKNDEVYEFTIKDFTAIKVQLDCIASFWYNKPCNDNDHWDISCKVDGHTIRKGSRFWIDKKFIEQQFLLYKPDCGEIRMKQNMK